MAVNLGQAARAEAGLPLVFKDDARPQVAGVRRDKGLAFPAEGQGQRTGGEADSFFQGVIEIHPVSPSAG